MADLYVCSVCSRTYPDQERFAEHAELTGHGADDDEVRDDGG